MKNIKKLLLPVLIVVIAAAFFIVKNKSAVRADQNLKLIRPETGPIASTISTTGTVLPKNRLEVKPPVAGRIESILVKEGDVVTTGQILGWMSSTERAALLDAARGKGEDTLKYWQDVYKPIPVIAPINGEVIVATIQPGQTITVTDPVVVLSDRLIVRAQIDETDIANVKQGQSCRITIDAYPDERINAVVEHIYYESKTVNNVTIYEADILPDAIPYFFRSGMNATIEFDIASKKDALLVPSDAVIKDKDGIFLIVREGPSDVKKTVTIGLTDDKNTEILSGVGKNDQIVLKGKKYVIPKEPGVNPFMPGRKR